MNILRFKTKLKFKIFLIYTYIHAEIGLLKVDRYYFKKDLLVRLLVCDAFVLVLLRRSLGFKR